MKWSALTSTQNLKLAWRRINTGRNLQYKRFFREAYLVYESGLDEHIKSLHRRLCTGVWEPQYATRIYLPKPSGLQRPLSLLEIEDQIVLQAIANIFAKRLYEKRQKVELKSVFSNKLTSRKDSIFFMERWQTTYSAFQDRCLDVFEKGYTWAADFDLAAYYETISHDLLLSIEAPHGASEPQTAEKLKKWLGFWSANNRQAITSHGIPQGPVASAFLAEAFFLPIDLRLQKEGFQYLRYVDDIRLFARTENEVRKAAILLEQICRHRGLIPQSKKFSIHELKSPQEAMGALPSIAPTDGRDNAEPLMTADKARNILAGAIARRRPQEIGDKSHFRYVMYRAPKDTEILKLVLRLLPRHPEHIDAFAAYFGNYSKSIRIVRAALNYLDSGVPYSYVRGELWHVIARIARTDELRLGLTLARQDARDRKDCVALSWGVMHFLMRCEDEGLLHMGNRLSAEHPISRSLLAPRFDDREFTPNGHAITLLKGTLMEQMAGARELQKRNVTLNSLGLRQKNCPSPCNTALKSLGVIRRQHRTTRDWIGESLTTLYGCKRTSIWRGLLVTEYEHALQFLIEAKARFPGAYSEWLSLQDSFNDIVTRQFFGFLSHKGLTGHSATRDRTGRLVKFGTLISENSEFNRSYPAIAQNFRTVHRRRNKLPGSHPYDEKGGTKNKWLTKKEQALLIPEIKNAFEAIAAVIEQNM